jgi:hypothetical protein
MVFAGPLRRNQSKMPLLPRCPARLFQPKPGHTSFAQGGGRGGAEATAKRNFTTAFPYEKIYIIHGRRIYV